MTFSSIIAAAAFFSSLLEAKRKNSLRKIEGRLFLHQREDLTLSYQPYFQVIKEKAKGKRTTTANLHSPGQKDGWQSWNKGEPKLGKELNPYRQVASQQF